MYPNSPPITLGSSALSESLDSDGQRLPGPTSTTSSTTSITSSSSGWVWHEYTIEVITLRGYSSFNIRTHYSILVLKKKVLLVAVPLQVECDSITVTGRDTARINTLAFAPE